MHLTSLHSWPASPSQAVALQRDFAERVCLSDRVPKTLNRIAGVDVSYRKRGKQFHAAVVVLDAINMDVVEVSTASGEVDFPYVPGLLSFRELPVLLKTFEKLQAVPDVILVDGQGLAHPRRFGLACHLGLWLELPTIGCAKSRLCGEFQEPGLSRGAWEILADDGEEIGRVVRTRDRVKPLFVSPGHKVDFDRAASIVLECGRGYRLPEPTRQAHILSNRAREEFEARPPHK